MRRFNRSMVLYKCLSMFQPDEIYEATDVARWLGVMEKHRLMRYYLNRLAREGYLIRLEWGHRTLFGLKVLESFLSCLDFVKRDERGVFVIKKRW